MIKIVFIICKKIYNLISFSDDTFLVFDYCQRSLLTVSSGDVIPQLPTKEMIAAGKNLILMTLLENYDGKTIEMVRDVLLMFQFLANYN